MKTLSSSDLKSKTQESPFISDLINKSRFTPLWRQIFAAIGPIVGSAAAGMTNGYSAILLPQLQRNDSQIQITTEQSSWIASMAALPMALGCIIGGIMMDRYGRKVTHLISSVTFAIGWIILSVANTYCIILVGRFATGLSCGLIGSIASVYIAESSDPKYRGFLLASVTLAVSSGILLVHVFGTFFHWKTTALLCSLFMVISYATVTISPESPSWLISKGSYRDAESAFRWLRGCDEATTAEYDSIVRNKKAQIQQDENNDGSVVQAFREKMFKPEFWKPFMILFVFFFSLQFSGANIVAFYSISIMKDTIGGDINEYLAMIIIDVVRVLTSLLACILLKSIGRRSLAIFSGVGTTISLIGLSLFLYFQTSISRYQNYSWMSLIFLVSYIVFLGIGWFPLPWCMTGELFPLSTRGLGSGLTSSWNFICFFIVIKTGPTLFNSVGVNGTYLLYGLICFLGTVILYFILPETRNKTLQEIENRFKNDKKKRIVDPVC